MDKIDFKKTMAEYYSPKNKDWELVDVPVMQFLMIDGSGDPNTSPDYASAVETLYSVSYPLKFMSKRELSKDYTVSVLEGLWYADDMSVFEKREKSAYKWTMVIMQPEWITKEMVDRAIKAAQLKSPDKPYDALRLESCAEGRSLQLLHVGSYDDEAPKLYQLRHETMPAQNLGFNGHHHEIYLSDPRRTEPSKLKTILRQPVRPQ
jgi:hypothetical protein